MKVGDDARGERFRCETERERFTHDKVARRRMDRGVGLGERMCLILVLSRERLQKVVLTVPPSTKPQTIEVYVIDIRGNKTRLGFEADRSIVVDRQEVSDAKERQRVDALARSNGQ